ncbi:MAG: class cytochrome c [Sphingomonas bacterium]|jgi:cytochrome c|nr:class cytochrome c [Sphingomonas bacterium]MDB5684800.1 class cytochrome c [Sphingomonas bacterium]MDB5716868.1 class cytochrome c [Sphingomonas bacterium]
MAVGVSLVRYASASLVAAAIAAPAFAAPVPKPPTFAVCGVCHKTGATDKSGIGPNLFGVSGRKAGTLAGFTYSPAMKASKVTWTRDKLVAFISDPRKVVPGTKMIYAGQKDPKVAGALADYVLSLK